MPGEPVQTLKTNAEVQVQDERNDCYIVQLEEIIGFISKENVSKNRITYGGSYYGGGSSVGGGYVEEWSPPVL